MSWIQKKYEFLIAIIQKNIGDRELVVWGENREFEDFYQKTYGVKITKHLFWTKSIIDDKRYFSMNLLQGNVSKYYVVNFDIFPEEKRLESLLTFDYQIERDFALYKHRGSVFKGSGNFSDQYNNVVKNSPENCKITFLGSNCVCEFEGTCLTPGGLEIVFYESGSCVSVKKDTLLSGEIELLGSGSEVKIGENCLLPSLDMQLLRDAFVTIGKHTTTAETGLWLMIHPTVSVEIGKDCMFSDMIKIWGGDGHVIYDIKSREIVNNKKNTIKLGDHVWIGTQVMIMVGADIGTGSVIGAGSFVNKKFPNNVTIGGVPAKVLRKDIAWTRKLTSASIADCGEENIHYTEETND